MKRLGDWLGREPLPVAEVVGWVVRLAKGVAPLHGLDEAHGRLTANAVHSAGPSARSRAQLISAEAVGRDFSYFSAERARRTSGPCPADDVWALGVMLYLGLTRVVPFEGQGRRGVAERIEWRPASPIEVYGVEHEPLQALLDRLFHPEPAERLTSAAALVEALTAIEPDTESLPGLELDRPTQAGEVPAPLAQPTVAVAPSDERAAGAPPAEPEPAEPAEPADEGSPAQPTGTEPTETEPTETESTETESTETESTETEAVPMPAPRPPSRARQRPSSGLLSARVLVPAFALVVVAAYALWRPQVPTLGPPAEATTSTADGAPAVPAVSASSAAAPPSAKPVGGAAVAASASVPPPAAPPVSSSAVAASPAASLAPPVPPRPPSRLECLGQLLPPATFEAGRPNLDFLCTEPDPRKGADALGTEIVLGKGRRDTTEAMREWDKLGWFQMALFAVARASCCDAAAPLQSRLSEQACQFDGALIAVGEAVAHGGEDDCTVAIARYLDAIQCLVDSHYAHGFGEQGPPAPRELPAFEDVSRRIRALRDR